VAFVSASAFDDSTYTPNELLHDCYISPVIFVSTSAFVWLTLCSMGRMCFPVPRPCSFDTLRGRALSIVLGTKALKGANGNALQRAVDDACVMGPVAAGLTSYVIELDAKKSTSLEVRLT
jgi:hypothetical protein